MRPSKVSPALLLLRRIPLLAFALKQPRPTGGPSARVRAPHQFPPHNLDPRLFVKAMHHIVCALQEGRVYIKACAPSNLGVNDAYNDAELDPLGQARCAMLCCTALCFAVLRMPAPALQLVALSRAVHAAPVCAAL